MNWFLLALAAPFLFAVSNYIDKCLVSKYFKKEGAGALVIFSSLIGFFLLPIVFIIQPSVFKIDPFLAFLMILNGCFYIITLIPYLYALRDSDTSVIVSLYQLIPFFAYILGLIFLKEELTTAQISASLLIISGAIGISFEYGHKGFKIKKTPLLLMILSCFLAALNSVIFKFVAIKEDFWTTSFWEYIGFSICGFFLLISVASYRKQFFHILKNNKVNVISINAFNEIINIIGKTILNFAALFIPVALVSTINGFHPFFVFVLGIILTLFLPKVIKEKIEGKYLLQKLSAIILMFVGVYLLNI